MNHDTKEKLEKYIRDFMLPSKIELQQENGFDPNSYAIGYCRGEISACCHILEFIEECYK